MGTIRVEFVPIKKYKLGLLGLDHLQIVYEDETSFVNKQDDWYVLEGTHEGSLLEGNLGVLGEDIRTELSAANGANGADLIAAIGTPEARGSRTLYTGPDALAQWSVMMDYGKEIQAQEFPYEGLAWPFSPGAIINSSSVVATLLYSIGIDINANMPFGVRNAPGTATLLGTQDDDEITLGGSFTQVAAGFGQDILHGTETLIWPEKFFGGFDDDTIHWSKGENFINGGEARTPYAVDGTDTVDYSGVGFVHIESTGRAVEHKVADFISTFSGGSDQLFSIESVTWNRDTDIVTVGPGVNLLEKPIQLDLQDSAGGKGDELGFEQNSIPLLVNAIDDTMISIQTAENEGEDAGYWAKSVEWLEGSAGDDRIYAGGTLRGVEGGAGDDIIDGRLVTPYAQSSPLGYDVELYGGIGNDTIVAGSGYSMAEGGDGADIFVVSTMGTVDTSPEFVITDAGTEDRIFIPYNYFQEVRGEFEGSDLLQLRGAPFKMDEILPVSLFFWGLPDENMVEGFIDFVGMIQYAMDGDDLIITIMMGEVDSYLVDNGPEVPPGPRVTRVVGDGESATFVRVVDWEEGDLGLTFPITYDNITYSQYGLANYPGFVQAVQNAVSPSAFLDALDVRPDAYVPQDIIASNQATTTLRTSSTLALESPTATDGDDDISTPNGGPYEIYGLDGNDTITASAGGDYIDGGSGADTMSGGRGNDSYVVDNAGDVIIEAARAGFDTIYASIDYVLGDNLEHLTLTGNAISGTGNALRNTLVGNARDNILSSGAGDDTLAGNGGNDTLIGGDGSDGYVWAPGDGDDIIVENAADAGIDVLVLAGGLRPQDVFLFRNPTAMDNLVLRFSDGGSFTILDYFVTPGTIEGVEFTTGTIWNDVDFSSLAQQALLTSNIAPTATADEFVYAGDTTFRLPVAALLDNDTDADGDLLSITTITAVSEGNAVLDGSEIVLTASASQAPRAVFTYLVSDGNGGTASATAEITFWPNSAPVITSSALEPVIAGAASQGQIIATDADGDTLMYSVEDGHAPSRGTLTFSEDGAFTYTPFQGVSGHETFTILVRDGFDASATQTFDFTIPGASNHAPVITSATLETVVEDTLASGSILATDEDNDELTYAIKTGSEPLKGTVAVSIDGSFTYTPNANATGHDTFTLMVTDTSGATAEHTFAFEIAAINDAPVATSDSGFTLAAGETLIISAEDLLQNDTDVDGDTITIAAVTTGAGGTAVLLANDAIAFTADIGFSGPASFSYTLSDGSLISNAATVAISVTGRPVEVGVTLIGTNCADRLVGTQFNDVIYGRKGDDTLIGLGGDDVFKFKSNDGLDKYIGGSGRDVVLGSSSNDILQVLSHLSNLQSIEEINGGNGTNDRIVATRGNDVLDFSNIKITGIEKIELGGGNDWVRGSAGADTFFGGAGSDTFVFAPGGGHDVIADFQSNKVTGLCAYTPPPKNRGNDGDIIDLQGYNFASYSDVRAAMYQNGHDVVLSLDAGSSVTLENVRLSQLSAWEFRI